MHTVVVSTHAIDRFIQRVDPTASRPEAALNIRQMLDDAKARATPRKWTGITARPGSRYLYSPTHPGICLVERGGRIRTVFARETSRQWRQTQRRQLYGEAA
jgi:hypothetical protein